MCASQVSSEYEPVRYAKRSRNFVDIIDKYDASRAGSATAEDIIRKKAGWNLPVSSPQRDEVLVRAYTGNRLYRAVNRALHTDDANGMAHFSGFIHDLREVFRTDKGVLQPFHGKVFRGISVKSPIEYVNKFRKGDEFMWAAFTSTSERKSAAFVNGAKTAVTLEIQCSLGINGTVAQYAPARISHLSQATFEDEVLFPPHVKFRVVNVLIEEQSVVIQLETIEFPSPRIELR